MPKLKTLQDIFNEQGITSEEDKRFLARNITKNSSGEWRIVFVLAIFVIAVLTIFL